MGASYAQMFQCLRALDKEFSFGLNPLTKAFEADPNLSSLLVAFAPEITENMPRFKRLVSKVVGGGSTSTPVMLSSASYIQTMGATSLPAGQAVALQRDVFGRHGFKRLDKEGDFNAKWPALQ